MNRTMRNFRLDIFLYLLLGMNIALIGLSRRGPAGTHPGFGWHIHAFLGTLLTLVCLIHIALHWRCIQAVLTGKAKGKGKLLMQGLITLMMLLATVSGPGILVSNAVSKFHNVTGTLALIGLSVHAIRNSRWMFLTARRLTGDQRHLERVPSSD